LSNGAAVTRTACFLELDERVYSQPGRLGGIARNHALFGRWVRKARLPVARATRPQGGRATHSFPCFLENRQRRSIAPRIQALVPRFNPAKALPIRNSVWLQFAAPP
jgi:hypothetical protein